MKTVGLWLLALTMLIGSLVLMAQLIGVRLRSGDGASSAPSINVFEVVAVVIALFSLYIAVASHLYAVESGRAQNAAAEKQQKALEAARGALEQSVTYAGEQTRTLKETFGALTRQAGVLEAQLRIAEEQWQREVRRQNQRPRLEFGIFSGKDLRTLPGPTLIISLDAQRRDTVRFAIRNVGDSALRAPAYYTRASNGVTVEPAEQRGLNVYDILPFSQSKAWTSMPRTITMPSGVERFTITFTVFGDNLEATTIELSCAVAKPEGGAAANSQP